MYIHKYVHIHIIMHVRMLSVKMRVHTHVGASTFCESNIHVLRYIYMYINYICIYKYIT